MSVEYRINYTIEHRKPGKDEFAEIGFGSSGAWGDVNAAVYEVESQVQNRQWETEPGQPDPSEVDR
ncbi:hypothetical protein [Micromonospora sp. NPDC005652]|uniref:hypothetical protein n=1 Tax=Micromonospora sp. NPDC005652 TaxID=3157046 RepID=UPI0033C9FBF7